MCDVVLRDPEFERRNGWNPFGKLSSAMSNNKMSLTLESGYQNRPGTHTAVIEHFNLFAVVYLHRMQILNN